MNRKIRNRTAAAIAAVVMTTVSLAGCRTVDVLLFDAGSNALRMAAGLETGLLVVDGHTIAYMERPGDGPATVLLHGFASEKDVWLRFLRELPDDRHVVAIDLPGHGDSSKDSEFNYDIVSMVTLIEGAIDELAAPPVHMVGASLGGMMATLYTARNPERVASLALFAPAGVYPPTPSEFQQALARGENPLIATNAEEFDSLIDIVFHDRPPMIWPIGSALRRYAVRRSAFMEKVWNDLWPEHPTLNEVLPGIETPVLLLWGSQDEVLDASSMQVFAGLLPDVQARLLDETGHALVNEKPREVGRLYRQFLAGLDQRGEPE